MAPVRHKLKLRPGFPAPLRQVAFHPLQARRSNALSVQSSSSTNSVVAAALGLIAAVIGGLLFFLSVVYGASAGLILVWLLLIIGGIFLAFRHLRNK
ncbi:hypothetical protein HNQ93_002319 [Hymenobacter luteus]|uniref:Uncharacterized protein n=2 Tax=Hymenobacter TaxID=89966 RepID=A0A7W9T284_9BACT|nr:MULTISPECIES: hypothetical protein [Hymenobacter]MBB4602112.1 hypothetical protein [Hymenobacter latericoloratus]MBB6059459.1 hypothetical protein [Hymenobacter luteus]